LASNATCATATEVESNTLLVDVLVVPVPVASIVGNMVSASPVPNASYQWYLDGDLLPGANTANYLVLTPGGYTVVATVDGCGSEPSNAVQYDINTGMVLADVPDFALVPNPTDGPLTIRTDGHVEVVEVWNGIGERVLVQRGSAIDLSGLASGIYHVVVIIEGQRQQGRVVLR
jgi:hypothetical protein